MAQLLKIYGYDAVTAATLEEADVLLETVEIAAMILDVGLQGADTGLDLLTTIRARPGYGKAPILIFTGGVLTPEEALLITRHRAFLFHKPEGVDTLVKFLDTLTGRDRPD